MAVWLNKLLSQYKSIIKTIWLVHHIDNISFSISCNPNHNHTVACILKLCTITTFFRYLSQAVHSSAGYSAICRIYMNQIYSQQTHLKTNSNLTITLTDPLDTTNHKRWRNITWWESMRRGAGFAAGTLPHLQQFLRVFIHFGTNCLWQNSAAQITNCAKF